MADAIEAPPASSIGSPDGIGVHDLLISAFLLLVALAPLYRSTIAGPTVGILALILAGIWLSQRLGSNIGYLSLLLLAAFIARVGTLFVDSAVHLFPKADAIGYHRGAVAVASSWWTGESITVLGSLEVRVYKRLIAPLYFWFGENPLLGRVLNSVLGLLATYNVFRITRSFYDDHTSLFSAAAFAFLPSLIRLQGELLRDAAVILALTQILYVLVSRRWRSFQGLSTGLLSLLVLGLLRREALAIAAIPIGIAAARETYTVFTSKSGDDGWNYRRRLAFGLAPAAFLTVMVLVVLQSGLLSGYSFDPSTLENQRNLLTAGDSAYLAEYTFDSWMDIALFAPLGAVYFLFTPFPWQVQDLLGAGAMLENLLLFYPLVLIAVPRFFRRPHRGLKAILVGFLVLASVLFGFVEGNIGTALRHRAMMTWVFFVFAGPSLKRRYEDLVWWSETETDPASA